MVFNLSGVAQNSGYVQVPGVYHVQVVRVDQHPTTYDGIPLRGTRYHCRILAEEQSGKMLSVLLFSAAPGSNDSAEQARKEEFLISCGIRDPFVGGPTYFEEDELIGAQLVVRMQRPAAKPYLVADAFGHVDDPQVPVEVLSFEALRHVPIDRRRSREWFDEIRLRQNQQDIGD
jgi:hypothetical protein